MRSIRSRLLLWQISALLLTAVVVSVLIFRLAWVGFNDVRDQGLEQIAQTVLRHDPSLDASSYQAPSHTQQDLSILEKRWFADDDYLDQFVSQVWNKQGGLLYSSLPEVGPPMQAPGHHIVVWHGQSWRLYTLPHAERMVQVAVTTHIRRQHFYELITWLLIPLGILVLVLGLLIHQAVLRSLRPLENMRRELSQRDVAGLRPVSTSEMPREIVPLAETLNQLLTRLDTLLVNQRRFLADAAHELNTPLAAVKLQAQLVRRAPETDRVTALDELDRGIARTSHLVSQLLLLARLEPDARQPQPSLVQLDELVRGAVVSFAARATDQRIDLGLISAAPACVRGDAQALRALLDNLVDNALRYAGEGARVDLALRVVDNQAVVEVMDNGPGIAPTDRERVQERFVRLDQGHSTGSGLGLAIVRHIADLHRAQLELTEAPSGGLLVRIRLALATCAVKPD
ncbi:MAG: ATP-binding protein [Hydrogenophaga sp.]|nr:ATP-binding protein [Hydrogenophaga sp.]MDP3325576.1 ATP-binding protein [Hydrogenophaga sp.]